MRRESGSRVDAVKPCHGDGRVGARLAKCLWDGAEEGSVCP
jgi:hypothetical protein